MMDDSSVRIEYAGPATGEATGGRPSRNDAARIDTLLREAAGRSPSRLAYADPPNRAAFGLAGPRELSFAQADAIATVIAGRFMEAGLLPGDRIALRLPNIVELPLALLGAWRAGLAPACLPMMWRLDELHHALPQIDPAAIFTVGRFGAVNHSDLMCRAAAQHIAIRHVFGLGNELSDGVIPADDWFTPATQPDTGDGENLAPFPADATAAMTWAVSPRGAFAVPRTHAEMLAVGRSAAIQLGLQGDDVVLLPYPMTSIASLGGHMVAALHAGAAVLLHQPFSYDGFIAQIQDFRVTCAAMPDAVLAALRERGDLERNCASLRRIGRIWPWPHQPERAPRNFHADPPVFDIRNIGELGLIIEEAAASAGLPLGKLRIGTAGDGEGEVFLETRVRGSVSKGPRRMLSGSLLLRGATVPSGPLADAGALAEDMLRPDAQGFVNTGLKCCVDEGLPGRFTCARHPSMIYHGGVAVRAEELDAAYASFPDVLDAAALAIDDPLMGDRIFAAVVPRPEQPPSLSGLKRFLAGKDLAGFKCPDRLLIVKAIPRDGDGRVLRDRILAEI